MRRSIKVWCWYSTAVHGGEDGQHEYTITVCKECSIFCRVGELVPLTNSETITAVNQDDVS
eukprot:5219603-Alexandrium_andersonii.AAC.1